AGNYWKIRILKRPTWAFKTLAVHCGSMKARFHFWVNTVFSSVGLNPGALTFQVLAILIYECGHDYTSKSHGQYWFETFS
ncbi:MAG: hypothetical protein V3V37_05100, partial [Candidatus Adiutricales bacterium]